MPKILMIAAYYPPGLSAGVQRTYHFAENLLQHGWQPLILSAHTRIYDNLGLDDRTVVSSGIQKHVRRAFAADASVHFAFKGKYFGFLENPDKIASWYYHGWRVGMTMVKEHDPDVIWSTFPVSTAHRIALKLKLKTGKLWVADFRDPLYENGDKNKKITEKAKEIDANTVKHADLLVFASGEMRDLYLKVYPDLKTESCYVIENGFDENLFESLERRTHKGQKFCLLYSGHLYGNGRDPVPLFHAISSLKQEGVFNERNFVLKFRGTGDGKHYKNIISELGLQNMIEFLPSVSYGQSIQEMKDASALLVLQGRLFYTQIPGKVYDYIATGNPIIGLLGKSGATSKLLATIPNAYVAEENDVDGIKISIKEMLLDPGDTVVDLSQFSRKMRGKALVDRLNNLLFTV